MASMAKKGGPNSPYQTEAENVPKPARHGKTPVQANLCGRLMGSCSRQCSAAQGQTAEGVAKDRFKAVIDKIRNHDHQGNQTQVDQIRIRGINHLEW